MNIIRVCIGTLVAGCCWPVRLVRTLLAGEQQPAGPGEARWYGRDDAGREAATGVYLYRLHTGEAESTRRMTLVADVGSFY